MHPACPVSLMLDSLSCVLGLVQVTREEDVGAVSVKVGHTERDTPLSCVGRREPSYALACRFYTIITGLL